MACHQIKSHRVPFYTVADETAIILAGSIICPKLTFFSPDNCKWCFRILKRPCPARVGLIAAVQCSNPATVGKLEPSRAS